MSPTKKRVISLIKACLLSSIKVAQAAIFSKIETLLFKIILSTTVRYRAQNATTFGVLCFPLTASTAPAESMIEARKPDHWDSIAWGNISIGACSHLSGDNEFIAAVSPLFFDNEHPCGYIMVVSYGRNSVVVKVVDRCADCTDDDLVLSPATLQTFIGRGGLDIENAALINATWDFQPSTQY